MQAPQQDQRRRNRLYCCVAVEVTPSGGGTPMWGTLQNINRLGCYVQTPSPLSVGTTVFVAMTVEGRTIVVRGKVVGSNNGRGVRTKFFAETESEIKNLREMLSYVEASENQYQQQNSYLAQLSRLQK